MNIVLIGPGALGCLLASSLALLGNGDHDIRMLDHDPDRAALLSGQGLVLEKDGSYQSCLVPVSADPGTMGQADIILLCVKSGAVRDGLLLAAKVAAPDGIVVTLQNGIGHLPLLQCLALPTVLGVTSLGATLTAPGHVRYAGRGPTRLGFATPPQPGVVILVACLAELLCRADIEVVVVDHILEYVWAKLFVNVGINALTAITNCTNGELLATARTRTQLIQAVGEAVAVARASGISVAQDPVEATMEVCRATRHNISSMLQDVRNRKPTEIEAINGAVVREGRRLHVETPVNEELVRSIKAIERAYAT